MAIILENQTYRVVGADYHPGQGQMGGATHARLQNIDTGTFREHSFRAELRLQDVPVEKHRAGIPLRGCQSMLFYGPGQL
jgi:translation elongation factor P/translation initiation factor 5A